jgi:hypothetical protein
MKRPLSDRRPLGPFAQMGHDDAEVNVYFEMKNLAPRTAEETEMAIEDIAAFQGPVEGPMGVQGNVVSLQTFGNQTTHNEIMELEKQVENETGMNVEDVEIIW